LWRASPGATAITRRLIPPHAITALIPHACLTYTIATVPEGSAATHHLDPDLSDLKYLIACEACKQGRIDKASFTKWPKTLDSMGKSFPINRMSEFPKILPQSDCSVMAPALFPD
jgi:hypothetical protein